MVSGDGHWICTSYSKVDGVNVYEREIQIARVYEILLKVYWLVSIFPSSTRLFCCFFRNVFAQGKHGTNLWSEIKRKKAKSMKALIS